MNFFTVHQARGSCFHCVWFWVLASVPMPFYNNVCKHFKNYIYLLERKRRQMDFLLSWKTSHSHELHFCHEETNGFKPEILWWISAIIASSLTYFYNQSSLKSVIISVLPSAVFSSEEIKFVKATLILTELSLISNKFHDLRQFIG